MVRNVMKNKIHKWGGNILSIYEGIEPLFLQSKLFSTKKIIFLKKMKCLEKPIMQNKKKIMWVSQPPVRGGGQAGWDKIPSLAKGKFLRLP